MICVVIKGPTYEDARRQITKALEYAELVELRLDFFKEIDLEALKQLKASFSIPMIFTLRSKEQGGSFSKSESERLETLKSLLQLQPEYIDIESHVSQSTIDEIVQKNPLTKVIVSYHNFTQTPDHIERIYEEMKKTKAYYYKIAVQANHSIDVLRLLLLSYHADGKVIAISMGTLGQVSRILGPLVGSPITYATVDDDLKTAPGQLTAKILYERYRYANLNRETALYGLIGDPIDGSISDETHNHLFESFGLNAVYIKMQVQSTEVQEFLQLAKKLPFRGLSVTMPLKEFVLPSLDFIDREAEEIGAVNTLVFKEGKISGYNTDGIGALNAIEQEINVRDKRVIILGSGGAARAIIFEACRRGASVIILNRNVDKAKQVAHHFHCVGKGLEDIDFYYEKGYDILINTTPDPMPIDSTYIHPKAWVMDIKTQPKETLFLKIALIKNCRIIYGYQMFVEQALGQFEIWFQGLLDQEECRKILEETALEKIS